MLVRKFSELLPLKYALNFKGQPSHNHGAGDGKSMLFAQ